MTPEVGGGVGERSEGPGIEEEEKDEDCREGPGRDAGLERSRARVPDPDCLPQAHGEAGDALGCGVSTWGPSSIGGNLRNPEAKGV